MLKEQEGTILITDGAYGGSDNGDLAASPNRELVTTDLTGKDVDVAMGAFEFNEDGTEVLLCPIGNSPRACTYTKRTGICQVSFSKDVCEHCPYRFHCHSKTYKKVYKVKVLKKLCECARMQANMTTE